MDHVPLSPQVAVIFSFPPISFFPARPHLSAYIEKHLREVFRFTKPSNTKDLRVKLECTSTTYLRTRERTVKGKYTNSTRNTTTDENR